MDNTFLTKILICIEIGKIDVERCLHSKMYDLPLQLTVRGRHGQRSRPIVQRVVVAVF